VESLQLTTAAIRIESTEHFADSLITKSR